MDNAAIGIQAHSGWGALIAVGINGQALTVLHRARLEITPNEIAGSKQPYHFAENLGLLEADKHLEKCAAASSELAVKALAEVVGRLRADKKRLAGCALLIGAGRPLPALDLILQSHALIHTAEGEFFRRIFWTACRELGVPVIGLRVRELDECAMTVLGEAATTRLKRTLQTLGKSIGPPWTSDQKKAALAATLVLIGERRRLGAFSHEPASLPVAP